MTVWAVVVAAGSGSRYGGVKQFEPVAGRRVVDWSVRAARSVADGVVVVVPPDVVGTPLAASLGADAVVGGGATRSGSVRHGLAEVPSDAGVIVVHDAARPSASPELFALVVTAVAADGVDAAVPGLPVTDTVKRVRGGMVEVTLERADLVAAQTPQAFRADALRRAHAGEPEATDDAALVEAQGGSVAVVAGEEGNLKITSPADLQRVAAVLAARTAPR